MLKHLCEYFSLITVGVLDISCFSNLISCDICLSGFFFHLRDENYEKITLDLLDIVFIFFLIF